MKPEDVSDEMVDLAAEGLWGPAQPGIGWPNWEKAQDPNTKDAWGFPELIAFNREQSREALAPVLTKVVEDLEAILTILADGAEVEHDSTETYLEIAQRRGGAMEEAGDLLIKLQDRLGLYP